LINELKEDLEQIVPLPAVLNQEYIAANQSDRVDNVFTGTNAECVQKIRKDI
jgi:myo-inositol-1-phosphate synthase